MAKKNSASLCQDLHGLFYVRTEAVLFSFSFFFLFRFDDFFGVDEVGSFAYSVAVSSTFNTAIIYERIVAYISFVFHYTTGFPINKIKLYLLKIYPFNKSLITTQFTNSILANQADIVYVIKLIQVKY